MEAAEKFIDLATRIPIRNINFYIEACRSMTAINLMSIAASREADAFMKKSKKIIFGEGLQADPQGAIELVINNARSDGTVDAATGIRVLGKLMIASFRQGEFKEQGKAYAVDRLPSDFLSCALVSDLRIHEQGRPSFSFVEKFLDDLADRQIIEPVPGSPGIRERIAQYDDRDLASVFLGYSFVARGALLPIVRFPTRPAGFVNVLIAELKKMIPRGGANRFIKSFRL
jgi:hypothetical protein